MKTHKIKFVILGLLVGLIVGIMAGLALLNPGMSVWEAAGTIGRVDQYRNVRITEADIELRNELLADENMREAYRNYLAYEYAANIKMGDDLRFAIAAGREHPGFAASNARTLERMEEYTVFLDNARLRILEAIGMLSDLSEKDRVAIRTVLNSAGSAIAQTQFRNGVVFDFMTDVENFFKPNPKAAFPKLAQAHDQLFANMLMNNIINDNRPVLEHLLTKEVMDEEGEFAQLDAETLRMIILNDAGNLRDGALLNEALLSFVIMDIEALRRNFSVQDAEHLRNMLILDASQLNLLVLLNAEALRNITALDSERLNDVMGLLDAAAIGDMTTFDFERLAAFDIEQLIAAMPLFDAEQLNAIMPILDVEQLNAIMPILDAEQLRDMGITDASQLRDAFLDNEQLSFRFLDGEQLRFLDAPLLQMNEVMRGSEMIRDGEFLRGSILFDNEQLRRLVL